MTQILPERPQLVSAAEAAELAAIPTRPKPTQPPALAPEPEFPPLALTLEDIAEVFARGILYVYQQEQPRIGPVVPEPLPTTMAHVRVETVRRDDIHPGVVAAAILDRAAQLIDRHGWVTGTFGNAQMGFCSLGAVLNTYETPGGMRIDPRLMQDAAALAIDALANRVSRVSGETPRRVTAWNDGVARPGDAQRMMRLAALDLRQKG